MELAPQDYTTFTGAARRIWRPSSSHFPPAAPVKEWNLYSAQPPSSRGWSSSTRSSGIASRVRGGDPRAVYRRMGSIFDKLGPFKYNRMTCVTRRSSARTRSGPLGDAFKGGARHEGYGSARCAIARASGGASGATVFVNAELDSRGSAFGRVGARRSRSDANAMGKMSAAQEAGRRSLAKHESEDPAPRDKQAERLREAVPHARERETRCSPRSIAVPGAAGAREISGGQAGA